MLRPRKFRSLALETLVHITRVNAQKILIETGQSATTFNGQASPLGFSLQREAT